MNRDGQMTIFDFLEPTKEISNMTPAEEYYYATGKNDFWQQSEGKPYRWYLEEKVCKHSEHKCNKEELWKVAESFDDIECKKVCCRTCDVSLCGARCNGSKEPKTQEVIVKGLLDDGYCPKCNACLEDLSEKCYYCGTKVSWSNWKIINEIEL